MCLIHEIKEAVTQLKECQNGLLHMNRILIRLLLMAGCQVFAAVNTTPQRDIDLDRYCGRWYEQARYDNWFEKGMDDVYTDYEVIDGDRIRVTNHGKDKKGHPHRANGRACMHTSGELMVSFVWPYWWFHAPYKILCVTPDYQGALVSGDGEEYLWILTRRVDACPLLMEKLKQEAQRRGFDTTRLRYTKHQKRKSTAPDTNSLG